MNTPRTRDDLHRWIEDWLSISLSRAARLEGHASHFDYVAHSYFSDLCVGGDVSSEPLDAVVLAPRGGGKTFLGALTSVLDLIHKPGIQIRIIAGSEEQGSRMYNYLREFLSTPRLESLISGKPTRTALTLANGSAVQVLAQSHAAVRGIRVHKIKCDEVELFDPDIFSAVQLTTTSHTLGEFQVRGTIECLSTQHIVGGIMQGLVKECLAGKRQLFRWTLTDVLAPCDDRYTCRPTGALPCPLYEECEGRAKVLTKLTRGHVAISDAMRMKSRVDRDTWSAEMLCVTPGRALAVFRDFSRELHVVSEDPPRDPERARVIAGMDFGYRNPTAILWAVTETLPTGLTQVTVVDEYQESQRSIQEHIAALKRRADGTYHQATLRPEWIGADPAGTAQTGASELGSMVGQIRRAGFAVFTERSDIRTGLDMIKAMLLPASGPPRLRIHSRCTRLIEALQSYHYSAHDPDAETPEKDGWDHLCDALRYMIVNLHRGTFSQRWYS